MLEIISAVVANNVKFNETKFQNENIKTLFEMFKQRENLSGLDSDLNSENLDLKSLSNSSENLHLNSHLNLANSSEKSNTNLNLNTLNLSENLSKTNSKDSLLKELLKSV